MLWRAMMATFAVGDHAVRRRRITIIKLENKILLSGENVSLFGENVFPKRHPAPTLL